MGVHFAIKESQDNFEHEIIPKILEKSGNVSQLLLYLLKKYWKMEKENAWKVRVICQSEKVGTML